MRSTNRQIAAIVASVAATAVLAPGAPSSASADSCPNAALRAGQSAALPDCRAYEQVTPSGKEADLAPGNTFGLSSASGDRFLLSAFSGGLPGSTSASSSYVITRGSSGWLTAAVPPPDNPGRSYGVSDATADLATVGIVSLADFTSDEFLAFGPAGGPFTTLGSFDWTAASTNNQESAVVGGTSGYDHVIFATPAHLVPGAASLDFGAEAIYEWTDGQLQLVNVASDGSVVHPCGAGVGNEDLDQAGISGGATNAVSRDGSTIFFEAPDNRAVLYGASDSSCGDPTRLYARKDGTTVEVSAPAQGVTDPNGPQPVTYAGAASDGSKVFFVTSQELTTDDTTHDPELYEYALGDAPGTGTLTRISKGDSGAADGDVQWVLVSDDGSTVYFAAQGQLVAGQGTAGQNNLYRYDTGTGHTTYIATLSSNDFSSSPYAGPTNRDLQQHWYTTPDGRYLLFGSRGDVTGENPSGQYYELYRYDSLSGQRPACLSCPATGTPSGDASFTKGAALLESHGVRPMSDDGAYVFFDSPERLVAQDVNAVRDVYEWHDGAVSLISGGTSDQDSVFVDSGAEARDVFFLTYAPLTPSDDDNFADVYDARIGGGFPAPAIARDCSGEQCQGALGAVPLAPNAGTQSVFGPGNAGAEGEAGRLALSVARPDRRALAHAARTGRLTLTVRVPAAGKVTAVGRGRIGKRVKTVGRSTTRTQGAGTIHLVLRLSAAARRSLRRHSLLLSLRVTFATDGSRTMRTLALTLRRR